MVGTDPQAPPIYFARYCGGRGHPGRAILRDIPSMHDPDVTTAQIGNHAEWLRIMPRPKRSPDRPGVTVLLSQVRLGRVAASRDALAG